MGINPLFLAYQIEHHEEKFNACCLKTLPSYLSEIIGMTSHPYFVVSGNNEVNHENF